MEQATTVNNTNSTIRLLEFACTDPTNSVSIETVLDLYDKIYETGTVSQINTAALRICNEYVARTRNAKDTQTNIRRKLGRAAGKVTNQVQNNLDDITANIKKAVNGAKSNFKANTAKLKANVNKGLGKTKHEAYISGLEEMDATATFMIHCDRILENYNRISKRYNIDRIICENTPINGIEDTTVEICRLIETYNMPDNVKFNTALETCWYGFQKNAIPYVQEAMVTAATDYFMSKGGNHNMCVNLLENSLVVSKQDYKDDDLELITEEDPEEEE